MAEIKLLTVPQVAARLQRKPGLIRVWAARGKFPNARQVERNGQKEWRIPAADLQGFAAPIRQGKAK